MRWRERTLKEAKKKMEQKKKTSPIDKNHPDTLLLRQSIESI
jgi:hypothetical protein